MLFGKRSSSKLRKKIYIFLNKKLISTDTIVPLCVIIKQDNPEISITYFSPDDKTQRLINQNPLLFEAINYSGGIKSLSPRVFRTLQNYNILPKLTRKFGIALNLSLIAFHVLLGRATIFHFGYWDVPQLRWFAKFKNKNFVSFQSNCWGSNPIAELADNVMRERLVNTSSTTPAHYVAFDDCWPKYLSAKEKGMKVTTLPPSRILPEWLHFVDKVSGPFIVRETRGIQISQTQKIFGIVLSAFDVDMTAGPDTVETYFIKTIGFLKKNYPESPVFVKPHPVLDRVSIKNLIDDSGHKLCLLTEMHSAVLGKICDIVVCNFFSFSITDAWVQGCRTIEYTEYAAAVTQILSEKSWRGEFIDMFVNGNDELFEQSVKRLLSEGRKKRNFSHWKVSDASERINALVRY